MALTDTAIKNAKPKNVNYKIADGNGLWLHINSNSSKIWRFRYKFFGRQSELSFGKYPDVTLAEARELLAKSKRLLRDGINPSQQRKKEKQAAEFKNSNLFASIAEEWHAANLAKWTPKYGRGIWRRLELHILPALGRTPVENISTLDLLEVLRKCEKKDKFETAHRALESCRQVFRYAVLTQRLKINPASDLTGELIKKPVQHYPTIDHNQLPEFLNKLHAIETTAMNRLAIKFLLQTFVRQGELRAAKWTDFKMAAKEWRIRPETTKMREMHIVPLSRQALALIEELYELSGTSEFLFPAQHKQKNPCMSENTINHVLHAMGYKGLLVAHGFRSLASTILNENGGFRPDVIERQLAHKERNKVRAAYNRAEYMEERRQMMQWWSDYLEKAGMSGSPDE